MAILLIGNVNLIDEKSLKSFFSDEDLFFIGKDSDKEDKSYRGLNKLNSTADFDYILSYYHPEKVVYISNQASDFLSFEDEIGQLKRVLDGLSTQEKVSLLYVAGPWMNFTENSSQRVLAETAESLCQYYVEHKGVDIKILRSLYLYSSNRSNIFRDLDELVEAGYTIHPEQEAYYVGVEDFYLLLKRVLEDWVRGFDIYSISDYFQISYLKLLSNPNGNVPQEYIQRIFNTEARRFILNTNEDRLRQEFLWFPRSSIESLLGEKIVYPVQKASQEKWYEKLQEYLLTYEPVKRSINVLIAFIFLELFLYLNGNPISLKIIDYRLIFAGTFGMLYGVSFGVLAAGLASLSLILAVIFADSNLLTLLVEPSNWIPFFLYFLVGTVTGTITDRRVETLVWQKNKLTIMGRQLDNEKKLTEHLLQRKERLTEQIVGRTDSYGQIYQFINRLDTEFLNIIALEAIQQLSHIFDTKEIVAFTFDKKLKKADVFLSLGQNMRKFDFDSFDVLVEQADSEEIWFNYLLNDKYPMVVLALQVFEHTPIYLSVDGMDSDKLDLYHQNILKISLDLVKIFYRNVLRHQQYKSNEMNQLLQVNVFEDVAFAKYMEKSHSFQSDLFELKLVELAPGVSSEMLQWSTIQGALSVLDVIGTQGDRCFVMIVETESRKVEDLQETLKQAGITSQLISDISDVIVD